MLNTLKLLLILSLFLSSPSNAAETAVTGRILTENGPLAGGGVFAYRNYADIQTGIPVTASERVDNSGRYTMRLPQGEYYLVARGKKDGKVFFAYHGNNPIRVEGDDVWVTLLASEVRPPLQGKGTAALKGVVTYKGKPVNGSYVVLYKPEAKRFKGLGLRTESTGEDGTFDIPVSSGSFVVIAKKIESGKGNRPLKKGDLYCYYPGNPVEVGPDSTTSIEVPCYPKNDRASYNDAPPIKSDEFKTLSMLAAGAVAGIRGRITDAEGKPVAGMLVLAYRAVKPVFLTYHLSHGTEYSAETNADGTYFIPIDASGDYYLVARDTLGDGPHTGELYGLYNGNSRHAVSYQNGKPLDNVNITVGRIMAEPKMGLQPAHVENEISAARQIARPEKEATVVSDGVIITDTEWKGRIVIKGVVVVKKGVTLTIRPGTTVGFARIDRDNNGVGDGELRIEGRIVARGTQEQRIVFTSAEQKPETRDWSYIHLLASQENSLFEYCRFEYGFSGIQVHYSSVRITDCLFTNNFEGLHFNTANVVADHNTFSNNGTAIRFKRLEGKVTISNNDIHGNEIGVLFGRQQINAVDFKNLNKPVEFPLFENNNFHDNEKYNFSMGEGQNLDISVIDNWWGAKTASKIEESIFDKSSDASLGRIIFTPYLSSPAQESGLREKGAPDIKTVMVGK
ncbi:MAG TPA: right-handed parallel beta-helix repeat-containing protein [Desulfuromonadaceae bacterium]|jgi:hypothetical protein